MHSGSPTSTADSSDQFRSLPRLSRSPRAAESPRDGCRQQGALGPGSPVGARPSVGVTTTGHGSRASWPWMGRAPEAPVVPPSECPRHGSAPSPVAVTTAEVQPCIAMPRGLHSAAISPAPEALCRRTVAASSVRLSGTVPAGSIHFGLRSFRAVPVLPSTFSSREATPPVASQASSFARLPWRGQGHPFPFGVRASVCRQCGGCPWHCSTHCGIRHSRTCRAVPAQHPMVGGKLSVPP